MVGSFDFSNKDYDAQFWDTHIIKIDHGTPYISDKPDLKKSSWLSRVVYVVKSWLGVGKTSLKKVRRVVGNNLYQDNCSEEQLGNLENNLSSLNAKIKRHNDNLEKSLGIFSRVFKVKTFDNELAMLREKVRGNSDKALLLPKGSGKPHSLGASKQARESSVFDAESSAKLSGLPNFRGATCYLNSCLQRIARNKRFDILLNTTVQGDTEKLLQQRLSRIVEKLRNPAQEGKVELKDIKPLLSSLRDLNWSNNPDNDPAHQQDSVEMWLALFRLLGCSESTMNIRKKQVRSVGDQILEENFTEIQSSAIELAMRDRGISWGAAVNNTFKESREVYAVRSVDGDLKIVDEQDIFKLGVEALKYDYTKNGGKSSKEVETLEKRLRDNIVKDIGYCNPTVLAERVAEKLGLREALIYEEGERKYQQQIVGELLKPTIAIRYSFQGAPDVLTFNVHRSVDSNLGVPLTFNLQDIDPGAPENPRYLLDDFVYRSGSNPGNAGRSTGSSGHYMYYKRDRNTGQWYCYNDRKVSPVTEEQVREAASTNSRTLTYVRQPKNLSV
ncbi:MAG: hypothetical protein ACQEP8_05505 [Chlamydiota bacterium]